MCLSPPLSLLSSILDTSMLCKHISDITAIFTAISPSRCNKPQENLFGLEFMDGVLELAQGLLQLGLGSGNVVATAAFR